MNIITNEKLIKRNARIGQVTNIVSLAILGVGMYITFKSPEQFSLSLTALLIGFLLSQIGIYFTNRWGKSPRPDEQLNKALKGLDKKYTLFHYTTPASHLLTGPAGIWVLFPKNQKGRIVYEKNRWKQKGGGLLSGYLKIFAQDSLGRPDLEISSETDAIKKSLSTKIPELSTPDINAALVLTHPDAKADADNAPVPTLHSQNLKDYLRKFAKKKPISSETLHIINDSFK
ncbi:MAG: hypothetical protein J7L73_06300 [Anaerolineales bacterium]|nr:hypothetical protein [Anaerolineales bacterium]